MISSLPMLLVLQFFMHTLHTLWVTQSVQEHAIVSLPTLTVQAPLDRVWPSVEGSQLLLPVPVKPSFELDCVLSNHHLFPLIPSPSKLTDNSTPPPHCLSRMHSHDVRPEPPRPYLLWAN